MSTVADHRRFILTEANDANHNKYWYCTRFADHSVVVEWGRVGVTKQQKTHPHSSEFEAVKFVDSKCREKTKKGYKPLKTVETNGTVAPKAAKGSLAQIALSQIATQSDAAKEIVELMIKTNIHQITGATTLKYDDTTGLFSTPCGVVDRKNVVEARLLLEEMEKILTGKGFKAGVSTERRGNDIAARYLMLIPQDMGMQRPTLDRLLPSTSEISKQESILDGLEGSLDAIESGKVKKPDEPADVKHPTVFKVALEQVTDRSIIANIENFYRRGMSRHHESSSLRPARVFEIKIEDMANAYSKSVNRIGNPQQLWHGTNVGNLLSILSKGLIIPSNAAHGRMFGNGVYFTDQSTKALNYSYGYWSGGSRHDHCFMFLVDVALGKAFTPDSRFYKSYPVTGYDSTMALAHRSGVINNEMIVYSTSQCNIRYLVEFKK